MVEITIHTHSLHTHSYIHVYTCTPVQCCVQRILRRVIPVQVRAQVELCQAEQVWAYTGRSSHNYEKKYSI